MNRIIPWSDVWLAGQRSEDGNMRRQATDSDNQLFSSEFKVLGALALLLGLGIALGSLGVFNPDMIPGLPAARAPARATPAPGPIPKISVAKPITTRQ